MTKKHYEAIAKVLATYAPAHRSVCAAIASDLAVAFRADNERFDVTRFLTAAGVA